MLVVRMPTRKHFGHQLVTQWQMVRLSSAFTADSRSTPATSTLA